MTFDSIDEWQFTDATLFRGSLDADAYRPIDVAYAASRAMETLGIRAPNRDAYVVPLFAASDPVLTEEYVLYRPEKDQVGWYDTGFGISGRERFVDCEDAAGTEIGHRVRGWLTDDRPDTGLDVDEAALPASEITPVDRLGASDRDAFFDDLRGFVRTERAAERDRNRAAYDDLGLDAAIRRGRATGPFLFVGETRDETGDPLYRFQYAADPGDADDVALRRDEGVYPGNRCLVDADARQLPVEADVRSVDGSHVALRLRWTDADGAVARVLRADDTDVWLYDLLNPVPFQRRLDAVDAVAADDAKRDLLSGARPVGFDVNRHATLDPDVALNEYQRLALLWADAANDVVCVHGPPGTGKTRTLTAYVRYAVANGHSVLVTAHSNQAVDNLLVGDSTPDDPEDGTLHALARDDESFSVARAGANSTNPVVREHYADTPVAGADVVAATTNGAAVFDRNAFDVGVVDEATQASRPATAIVLHCTRRLVLAGDHEQLPPYCADETMHEGDAHVSLFEYLLERYGDDIAVLLRTQYRMHEAIAAFPNRAFYDGALETAARNRTWTVGDLDPVLGVDVDGTERRDGAGTSFYNPAEADVVATEVERLVDRGVDPADVGVIAAYRGQVDCIERTLRDRNGADVSGVTVDTVDSFQGSEREAVVVSFVRSNDEGRSGFLAFPDEGPRRLNVALTRARKRLVLVGDWETLGTVSPHRKSAESAADVYAALADHLRAEGWMRTPDA